MRTPWPTEARAFQESVAGTLARLGGIELTRECERDPASRAERLGPAMDELSIAELDVSAGAVEAATAALAMRAAGNVLCAWPLGAQLAVPADHRDRIGTVYVVDGEPRRLEHLDLVERPVALDIRTGEFREVLAEGPVSHLPLDPFGVNCELGDAIPGVDADFLAPATVLDAYWILGALDRVLAQVAAYAAERHQFGRPIASFGAIQWRLSDLAVAHAGLDEIAGFTLQRLSHGRANRADVLGLRYASLQSASRALTHGHQILGAIGLCEEHDVTVVDRHLQSSLRRPCGIVATTRLLAEAVAASGFDAIHPIRPVGAVGAVTVGGESQ